MNKLLLPDGTFENITPANNKNFTLEELQEYVGGYIQLIHLQDNVVMVINEEGKLLDLPRNDKATVLANFHPDFDDYIMGNVVICKSEQVT
jgi:Domain of unknown function (DUF3846)